jgi:hypothetical protein
LRSFVRHNPKVKNKSGRFRLTVPFASPNIQAAGGRRRDSNHSQAADDAECELAGEIKNIPTFTVT